MTVPERFARTLAFSGFILSSLGLLLPVLADFREFNGLDCVLFFLNTGDTLPFSIFMALFFLGALSGAFFCLRRKNRDIFILAAALVCSISGSLFCVWSGLGLSLYGWAAFGGAAMQLLGCIALVFLKLGPRPGRSY